MEVHRCGRKHGVDRVPVSAPQPVALQPVFVLQMPDAGLNRGATFHPAPQRPRSSAPSALVDMHCDRAVIVVAAIAHVHMHLADPIVDHAPDLLDLLGQRVAVVRITGEALGAHQPSAPARDR